MRFPIKFNDEKKKGKTGSAGKPRKAQVPQGPVSAKIYRSSEFVSRQEDRLRGARDLARDPKLRKKTLLKKSPRIARFGIKASGKLVKHRRKLRKAVGATVDFIGYRISKF